MKNSFYILLLLCSITSYCQQLKNDKRWLKTIENLQEQLPYFETNLSCDTCKNGERIRKYSIDKTIFITDNGVKKDTIQLSTLTKVVTNFEGVTLIDKNNNELSVSYIDEVRENAFENTEDFSYGFTDTKQAKNLEKSFTKLLAIKERFKKQYGCKPSKK